MVSFLGRETSHVVREKRHLGSLQLVRKGTVEARGRLTWSLAKKFSQLSPLVDEKELAQGHSAGDSARWSTGGPGGSCSYQGPPKYLWDQSLGPLKVLALVRPKVTVTSMAHF